MSTMVDAIVTSLVKNVSQLLVQESNLVLNARDQLLSLQDELKFINEFLKRHSQEKRAEVREEVKQIKDVALEAEDLLDAFVINMAQYKRKNWLMRLLHVGEKALLLRNVAVEVQRINKKLKKIHENKDKYDIATNEAEISGHVAIQSRRRNVEEDEVVSFNNEAEQVMKMLETQDPRRGVVSIVGMGGLGKTTLAKKIYNSSFVKDFDFRAWVDVSQDYSRKELLLKIAKSVFPSMDFKEVEEGELEEKLRSGLEGKRYMIVLDDVWDKHLWNEIKAAFPDNGKRSRILLTTRLNDVASHAGVHYPLPLLNEDDSWKLFAKKVFHDQVFHPNFEQVARQQILPKCKGLPLAIVVVAGLLKNREESMWLKVASGLDWYLAQNPTECLGILALSYDDLPPHLKPCFLYFGVFPEDYEIPFRRLIRLWIAEGFVDEGSSTDLDMEDMAEEYLLQLIDRSLIQVVKRRSDGGVKSCRIHDLLRDLCIFKGEEENFLVVKTKAVGSSLPFNKPIRRLSVDIGSSDIRYDMPELSRLRSLLTFGFIDFYRFKNYDVNPFCGLSKLLPPLRVLDFDPLTHYKVPPIIEKLVHLRYLRINSFVRKGNVASICNANLQTLDLEDLWFTLRVNIWGMKQLRHLILPKNGRVVDIRKGNENCALPNLCTLSNLFIREEDELDMLERFPNLKNLEVWITGGKVELFKYLSKLQRLQVMTIRGEFKFTSPELLPLSLTKITLSNYTNLDTSAFTNLGGLPNLQVLKLRYEAIRGRVLEYHSDQGMFPKLQVLHICDLSIRFWSMKGQGLQSLVYLLIDSCRFLEGIPDELKQISTLRHFEVRNCIRLKESLKHLWGDDPRYIYI